MRRLLLINPPIARYDVAELAPPLSLLTLAARARSRGMDATILDLNLPRHRAAGDEPESYVEYAVGQALDSQPDVIGVTSMGVNAHVACDIARSLASQMPSNVFLGGIHVSNIASHLRARLGNDVAIVDETQRRAAPNEWWGTGGEEFVPAEALWEGIELSDYVSGNPRKLANLEAGRGCKYKCAFCYSPRFHLRWVTRPAVDVVDDMAFLAARGLSHAFIVDDNFINSHEWANSFCDAWRARCPQLTWNGYASLPDCDPVLLSRLADSGCTNLYVGVDATDRTQQREWHKQFFRSNEEVLRRLAGESTGHLSFTAAFILDLAPGSEAARMSNLDSALHLAKSGLDVRLSVLTYYPGTELGLPLEGKTDNVAYSEARTALLMDLPAVVVRNDLAREAPWAFPWHARPAAIEQWDRQLFCVSIVQHILTGLPGRAKTLAALRNGQELWSLGMEVADDLMRGEDLHKSEIRLHAEASLRRMMFS